MTHAEANQAGVVAAAPDVIQDADAWRALSEAENLDDFARCWLNLQCQQTGSAQQGFLCVTREGIAAATLSCNYPDASPTPLHLAELAGLALAERRGVVKARHHDHHDWHDIAYPIPTESELQAVVAVTIPARDPNGLQLAMRQLQWGSGWLQSVVSQGGAPRREQLVPLIQMVATLLSGAKLREAATALTTEMADLFECQRVSLGLRSDQRTRMLAISHSADFSSQSNLVGAIEGAMDEAIDQGAVVSFPDETPVPVTRVHEQLCTEHDCGALFTAPFGDLDDIAGAFTFERPVGDPPFDRSTQLLCEQAALLLGPIIEARRRNDQPLHSLVRDRAGALLSRWFGRGRIATRLGVITVAGFILFTVFVTGDYRVTADAALEGRIQRAVVAPFDGYVADADVRAGELVEADAIMARLDARDLKLERLKWQSQLEQHQRAYRDAMAKRDRGEAAILKTQIAQAEVQVQIVEAKLERTVLRAPIAGFVVTGDLTQRLNAPVAIGELLFEVAPLDEYRVVIRVDERDIDEVQLQQTGRLTLTSAPETSLPIEITNVTSVSTVEEGANVFRIEATLGEIHERLRPGMEGVAKIDIGQRSYLWIWTHRITDWLTMQLWSWIP